MRMEKERTMKATLSKLALATCIAAQLFTLPAFSAIPRTDIIFDITKIIEPIASLRTIRSEDIAKFIPSDMTPSSSGGYVATRILDHSLQTIFKSPELRRSELGRSAQKLESVMETDVSFGGGEKGDVKHSVKFKMKPVQAKAQLDYTGYVNAQLSYQIQDQSMNLEVFEKVASNTDLVLTHNDSHVETRDMLSLRWNW
jgi:hypothetical protein